MEIKSTLKFFRDFHRIPKSQKLEWCICRYDIQSNSDYKQCLGVLLTGTGKFIDIANGQFREIYGPMRVETVKRESDGGWYFYIGETMMMRTPKYYIHDMYYKRVYTKDMIDSFMF